jgi:hypothetical protein
MNDQRRLAPRRSLEIVDDLDIDARRRRRLPLRIAHQPICVGVRKLRPCEYAQYDAVCRLLHDLQSQLVLHAMGR